MGEMKRGRALEALLSNSPACFAQYFAHCRSLEFEARPDYSHLRSLLRAVMVENGWPYDWQYDWLAPTERGTLLPTEYRFDPKFVRPVRHRHDLL